LSHGWNTDGTRIFDAHFIDAFWWGERPREPLLKKGADLPKRLARTLAPPAYLIIHAFIFAPEQF
jgi:hypothetical protein